MEWRDFSIDDFAELKVFFVNQPYFLSTFSLPSLIAWSSLCGFQMQYQILDGRLLMRALHQSRVEFNHLKLPLPNVQLGLDQLRQLLEKCDVTRLWHVPKQYIEAQDSEKLRTLFVISEQTLYEDYIYSSAELAQLDGKRYSKKRNLIAQFEREYLDQNRVQVEHFNPAVISELLAFLDSWCKERACDEDVADQINYLKCEKRATGDMLSNYATLDVAGILIRIDGIVSALAASTYLHPQMGVLNIEKAFSSHKGLYQYLDREAARRLFLGRYEWINKESDMGMDNLRQAKESYHPAMRTKCYELVLR